MPSKRIDAAIETDDQILALETEVQRIASYGPYLSEQLRMLDERVTALESAPTEPPTEPPVEPPTQEREGVVYTSCFETGAIQSPPTSNPDGWEQHKFHANPDYKDQQLTVVTEVPGSAPRWGTYCLRAFYDMDWGPDTNGKQRSEVRAGGAKTTFDVGEEAWIGFSVYMANNEENRKIISAGIQTHLTSVFQFHGPAGEGSSHMSTREGYWAFKFGALPEDREAAPIVLGQWNDFIIHFKVASDNTGFCTLWLNADSPSDAPIYSYATRKTSIGDYLDFKMGIYHGNSPGALNGATKVEKFYDEFRLAQGPEAGFYSVKP